MTWIFGAGLALAAVVFGCSSDNNNNNMGPPMGGMDAGTGPTGCQSMMMNCDTCVTAAQDPLNACSATTVNCIPFDNSRVPKGPDGKVPSVP